MSDFMSSPVCVTRSKTDHVCSWCGEKIHTGDPYTKYTSISDGCWLNVKLHPECMEAVNKTNDEWYFYQNDRGIPND